MHKERDPRVVKIAEKLAEVQPYGFEYVKSGPSAADYHAALLAVETLDAEAEWEYNIECLDLVTGHTSYWRPLWEPDAEWLQKKLDARKEYDRKLLNVPNGGPLEYEHKLVKRRKPGRVEDV